MNAAAEGWYCLAVRLIAKWNTAPVSLQKEGKVIEGSFAGGNMIDFIYMRKQN